MSAATLTQSRLDLDAVNQQLETADPDKVVAWAVERFGQGLVLTSSFGAESALMLHLVTKVVPDIPVVAIDTGYFFPETYRFMEELTRRFKLNLKVYQSPISPARMEALHGRLWEEGAAGLTKYDQMRKVEPMERALRELGVKAWLAGLRRDQTDHRKTLRVVEARPDGIVKVHPILNWTEREIDAYFIIHDLPKHPLVAQGYRSIGDHHTTRPVAEGESARAGRFGGLKQECGLHLPASVEEGQSRDGSAL